MSGAEATVVAAALAAVVALLNLAHTARVARRTAWWTRAQWAIDKTLDEQHPEAREVGAATLAILGTERRVSDQDVRVLQAALTRALDRRRDRRGR